MRVLIRPFRDVAHPIDVTDPLVDAIARELARRCGGNAVLNRLEAAAQLARILEAGPRIEGDVVPQAPIDGRATPLGDAGDFRRPGGSSAFEQEKLADGTDARRIAPSPDRRLRRSEGVPLQGSGRVAGAPAAV